MDTLVTRKRFTQVTTTSFVCSACGYDEVKVVATARTTGPARILSVTTTPHSLLCGACEAQRQLRASGYVPEAPGAQQWVRLSYRGGSWTVDDAVRVEGICHDGP